MRIPLGDNDIGFVSESQFITDLDGIKCRSAWFSSNDIYQDKSGRITMTYKEFKEKYPIESPRYRRMRFIERKYN